MKSNRPLNGQKPLRFNWRKQTSSRTRGATRNVGRSTSGTRAKYFLQLFDHAAIYFLIAGTYTPFALGPLRRHGGLLMLGLIWFAAMFGVLLKVIRGPSRHRKLAMSLYLGMGWMIPLTNHPLMLAIPFSALMWLLAGGIAYTAGVLFFVNQRLRYSHFIWHLFVLAGTACHFAAVLSCVA